jgi:diguanylate cyclase (GGDEF)-like protein
MGLARYAQTRQSHILNQHIELSALRRDGSEFPSELAITAIRQNDQDIFTAYIRDITERKQLEDQVRELAFHDTLTNLPNRRLLNDRLRQAMAANRRSGCFGALMLVDLDNFKPANDAHGHGVGDILLVEVAVRLKSCVREVDTVARLGGDEFVVMLSDLNTDKPESTAQAGIIAEKLRTALAKPYVLRVRHEGAAETIVEHRCTASIGVALFGKDDADQEDILKRADMAMYQAKEAGRNVVLFVDQRA